MMQTIDPVKALGPRQLPTEKLHIAVLMAHACNTIMLGVCDDVKETEAYSQEIKMLTNQLTKRLDVHIERFYKGNLDVELTHYKLVRIVEESMMLVCRMEPSQVETFNKLITLIRTGSVELPADDTAIDAVLTQKSLLPAPAAETLPLRIQRKRTRGFRLPENTVCVTRPGKWSNPFTVEEEIENLTQAGKKAGFYSVAEIEKQARINVVQKFRDMMNNLNSHEVMPEVRDRFKYMRDRIFDLKDKNLACYCSLDGPCHRDVLITLANPIS
ncbi:DUF4326 domain-containing protein [Spirosoma sp.]|uniref:DUF4326 domain-containing protein n=1 Tax=Spirosoma sp. TaxID=1899569 RepID=UPI0026374FE8|nr:DUF4326 domain-containing protein [Spirosoma sp.]MCX6217676.1 DUF4326 domain-containing protein [Spirosoma sp.]